MQSLQPQIARHDSDELSWVDMWLAQMLRHESYPFFEPLLSGNTLEEVAGYLYAFKSRYPNLLEKQERNDPLRDLLGQTGIRDQALIERLTRLVEACRARSSQAFRYMCELANRPHALTWKEFRAIRAKWESDPRPALLKALIEGHAKGRGVSVDDVDREIFETILLDRGKVLEEAAQAKPLPEHEEFADRAGRSLLMIQQFLGELGGLDAQRFEKLYEQAKYWIGFCKNPGDLALRGQEEDTVVRLLSAASDELSTELLECLLPSSFDPDVGDGSSALREQLRRKCMSVVAPKAAKEAVSFLARPGGIQSLTERDRFPAVKYCLFKSDSPIWKGEIRIEFIALIRSGRDDCTVYSNVSDLFDLMVRGLRRGGDSSIDTSDVGSLLSNQEFSKAMWDTVTSRPIQYRMQMSYIESRQLLIQNGVPEAALALTDELKSRLEEDAQLRAGRQTPASPSD